MRWLVPIAICLVLVALLRRSKRPVGDHLDMVGLEGVAEETFSREGKVFVRGELWRATARKGIIQKGSQVRVQSVEPGLLLVVESAKDR
jgi:membrane-bound ClpP family serine protease